MHFASAKQLVHRHLNSPDLDEELRRNQREHMPANQPQAGASVLVLSDRPF